MISGIFGGSPAKKAPHAPAPAIGVAPVFDHGVLLDTLGALLRAYARDAFDLGSRSEHDVRALVQAWALHATNGSPRPGRDEDPSGLASAPRDPTGLLLAFAE